MTKKNRVIGVFLVVAAGIMAGDVIKSRLSNTLPGIVSLFPRFELTRQPSITQSIDKQPPGPASPDPSEIHELIQKAARKNGVSAAFVKSVVAAESNFNAGAVSPKGAIGLMQLMPETARQFGADPSNPQQNIDAGTHYLKDLLTQYNGNLILALAAYNAGPDVVNKYRGVPPFPETRAYVRYVTVLYERSAYKQYKAQLKSQAQQKSAAAAKSSQSPQSTQAAQAH